MTRTTAAANRSFSRVVGYRKSTPTTATHSPTLLPLLWLALLSLFAAVANGDDAVYNGGRLLSQVKVYAIFWNDEVENIDDFDTWYRAVVPSNFLSLLSEYNDPNGLYHLGPGVYLGYMIHTGQSGITIPDATLKTELTSIINAKLGNDPQFPAPKGDTLYVWHFPSSVRVLGDAGVSCAPRSFAGYHTTFVAPDWMNPQILNPDRNILYAVVATCSPHWPAAQYSVTAHEIVEAVTDPETWKDSSRLGWVMAADGEEIADVCQKRSDALYTIFGVDGNKYFIQKFWSNKYQDCIPNDNVQLPQVSQYSMEINKEQTVSSLDSTKDHTIMGLWIGLAIMGILFLVAIIIIFVMIIRRRKEEGI